MIANRVAMTSKTCAWRARLASTITLARNSSSGGAIRVMLASASATGSSPVATHRTPAASTPIRIQSNKLGIDAHVLTRLMGRANLARREVFCARDRASYCHACRRGEIRTLPTATRCRRCTRTGAPDAGTSTSTAASPASGPAAGCCSTSSPLRRTPASTTSWTLRPPTSSATTAASSPSPRAAGRRENWCRSCSATEPRPAAASTPTTTAPGGRGSPARTVCSSRSANSRTRRCCSTGWRTDLTGLRCSTRSRAGSPAGRRCGPQ